MGTILGEAVCFYTTKAILGDYKGHFFGGCWHWKSVDMEKGLES